MKRSAIIIDIDGTCTLDPRATKLADAAPNEEVAHVIHLLVRWGNFVPIFVTGRVESQREHVRRWLVANVGTVADGCTLHMRKDDDRDDDAAYKEKIYRTHIEPEYDTRIVLEDRPSTVAMWRKLGLQAWQVAAGPE